MTLLAAALLLQASPEAIKLGEELASYGTLATLGPIMTAKEADDLVAAHPELTKAEQDSLRATAKKQAEELRTKAIRVEGQAFAETLSLQTSARSLSSRGQTRLSASGRQCQGSSSER